MRCVTSSLIFKARLVTRPEDFFAVDFFCLNPKTASDSLPQDIPAIYRSDASSKRISRSSVIIPSCKTKSMNSSEAQHKDLLSNWQKKSILSLKKDKILGSENIFWGKNMHVLQN